jgi:5-amino-6-(5-phosphoribosylamino)uracil reductase
VRALLPQPTGELSDEELVERFAYPARTQPWLRANMVTTVDGAAAGPDRRSASISSAADVRLFHLLRGLADVVVAGSGTAVAEWFGPADPEDATGAHRRRLGQRPAAVLAIASSRLDLDLDGPLFRGPADAVVVLTSAAAPAERRRAVQRRADVLVVGEERVDPVHAVEALEQRGLGRVLCEGGPTLLSAFVAAGVLDELCLTTSPLLIGGSAGRVLAGVGLDPPVDLVLTGLLEELGSLFSRWTPAPR